MNCFNTPYNTFFIIAFVLAICSIWFYVKVNLKFAVAFLFLAALIFRITFCFVDEFLYLWDEQFHALVAKNMVENPFKPMLYANPVLDYNYKWWDVNHVWLHKQPLFLWIIACSIKLFGASTFAVRLPSAILFSIMTILIYRIGKLTVNASTGWWAALLFSLSGFFVEVAIGSISTDHNDAHFIFWICATVWSFVEYKNRGSKKWLVVIGVFSGFAILTKWLVGLLVYFIWFVFNLSEKKFKLKQYADFFSSLLITILIALPWQLYIINQFPLESAYEYALNTKHFFEEVEGHAESWDYHFVQFPIHYGWLLTILFPFIFYVATKKIIIKHYIISFAATIVFVYVFYSLAVTKMPLFTCILLPFMFIFLGTFFCTVESFINSKIRYGRNIFIITSSVLLFITNNIPTSLIDNHTNNCTESSFVKNRQYNYAVNNKVKQQLMGSNYVVFNTKRLNAVPFMFQTGFTAYGNYPTFSEYNSLKNKHINIAVFVDDNLPYYLDNDSTLIRLNYILANE